jgi:hypothetical protein
MEAAGLEVATPDDIVEAHALVERLVGPPLAGPSVMRAIHDRTQASVFVIREDGRITGVLGELALVEAGLRALETGTFNGVDPDLEHIARPGDPVSAWYCWGFAAETRRAAAIGVKATIVSRNDVYRDLPLFARAVKPAGADEDTQSNGARVGFRRFGCTPYPGQPDLIYSPRALQAGSVTA